MNRRKIFVFLMTMMCVFCQLNVYSVKADATDYQIRINLVGNRVTVFSKGETGEYDVEVKTMACSAYDNGVTDTANYEIIDQNEWRQWSDKTFSKYVSQIAKDIFICTSPYSAKSDDTLITDLYNGIGENRSPVNIWVSMADAKWIYDNCQLNTSVVIYNDETNPGSGNNAHTIDIPLESPNANWDPTSDLDNNPWKSAGARIEGAKDIEAEADSEVDLLSGIKAYDTCGNDITGSVLIMGVYDLHTPGLYNITYYVKDSLDSQANASVNLNITKTEEQLSEEASEEAKETIIIREQSVESEKTKGEKLKILIILALLTLGIWGMILKYVKNK